MKCLVQLFLRDFVEALVSTCLRLVSLAVSICFRLSPSEGEEGEEVDELRPNARLTFCRKGIVLV